jgi:small subunit ribosomal protein S17
MPKRVLIGTVVSDKGDKTVTVRVDRRVKHPLYGKIIRRSKKYHAHDADNAFRVGEQVRIEECKPISKMKSWTVIERIGAAKAAVIDIDEPDVVAPEKDTKAEAKADKKTEKPAKASKAAKNSGGKAKAEDVAEAESEA